jgi:hypothetical protein
MAISVMAKTPLAMRRMRTREISKTAEFMMTIKAITFEYCQMIASLSNPCFEHSAKG